RKRSRRQLRLAVFRCAGLHAEMKMLPLLLLLGAFAQGALAETIEGDIGVSAACTAAQFGKRVALAEFGRHIGGLTSGGLGWTDIGNKAAVGGFSRTF